MATRRTRNTKPRTVEAEPKDDTMAKQAVAVKDNAPEIVEIDDLPVSDEKAQEAARVEVDRAIHALANTIDTSREAQLDAWQDFGRALLIGRIACGNNDKEFGKWIEANGFDRLPGKDDDTAKISSNARNASMLLAACGPELKEAVVSSMRRGAADARSFANKLDAIIRSAYEIMYERLKAKQFNNVRDHMLRETRAFKNAEEGQEWNRVVEATARGIVEEWRNGNEDDQRLAVVFDARVLDPPEHIAGRKGGKSVAKNIADGLISAEKRLGGGATPFNEQDFETAAQTLVKRVRARDTKQGEVESVDLLMRAVEIIKEENAAAEKAAAEKAEKEREEAEAAAFDEDDDD